MGGAIDKIDQVEVQLLAVCVIKSMRCAVINEVLTTRDQRNGTVTTGFDGHSLVG